MQISMICSSDYTKLAKLNWLSIQSVCVEHTRIIAQHVLYKSFNNMKIAEEVQTRKKMNCLGTSHLTSEWLCLLCTVYITWKLAAVEE